MARPTKQAPERGDARTRLLQAARDLIREKGFSATSIEHLCRRAEVTKGAFFHQFSSKEQLGVAAVQYWSDTTAELFAGAPYHRPDDALGRVLAYIAFRRAMIEGELARFTCLAGTMVQEMHDQSDDIRAACGAAIFAHADTLIDDIQAARQQCGIDADWSAESLARHTQAVIQGGFILAKAGNSPELARETIDHLERYVRCLFHVPDGEPS